MLIIGCPVYKRDWILPHWFACIQRQTYNLKNIGFVFELGADDKETFDFLVNWKKTHPQVSIFDIEIREDIAHHAHEEGTRRWSFSKYENMVSMRNSLLDKVKKIQPDFYYSLDSDILLTNPNTIEFLLSHITSGSTDAINTLMFMTPFGVEYPSVMSWHDSTYQKAHRNNQYPFGSLFQADVIMAGKMMSKDVYNNSRYKFHTQGEDLGWSADCAEKGFKLSCASYIYTPHIMGKEELKKFLSQGDNRYELVFNKNDVNAHKHQDIFA